MREGAGTVNSAEDSREVETNERVSRFPRSEPIGATEWIQLEEAKVQNPGESTSRAWI
jgi:hypothetical protein